MNARVKKIAVAITATAILMALILGSLHFAFPSANGAQIDLFTQRELFNGKGLNGTSNAFAPGEEVQVYAYVSYNNYEVPGVPVAFGVQGPANSVYNITLFATAFTNETGIANVSFRIPQTITAVFGNWTVAGNARVDDVVVQDFLTFRVGWIVEITSVRTLNEDYASQENFTLGEQIIVELGLKSIAMTNTTTTLAVTLKDSLGHPINSSELTDFVVPSKQVATYAYLTLIIPENASIGIATAYACAYTMPIPLGGVAYGPEVSAEFRIVSSTIMIHDIAVLGVFPLVNFAHIGDVIGINVLVKNEGNYAESFNVTTFYNESTIGVMFVNNLEAGANGTLFFSWSTQNVGEGNYTISAFASPVAGEQNLANNYLVDGIVRIESRILVVVHDIAILNVVPSSTSVLIGDILNVNVLLKNNGTISESFSVILYYGQNIAGVLRETDLAATSEATLTFDWNTTGIAKGNYKLAAFAIPVAGETNTANNYFVDGTVTLVQRSRSESIPLWFFWFLLALLLALIVILLLLWFYYRRQGKKSEDSFYSGWSAWYYSYNMQPKTPRTKA